MIDFGWSGWVGLGAIGQIAAAAASVIGLFFIWLQIRAARRAADFDHLIHILHEVVVREDALVSAPGPVEKRRAFFEFANLLEVFAAAINHRLLPPAARRVVRGQLVDSLVEIEVASEWHSVLQEGLTSVATWEELAKFVHRERGAIAAASLRRKTP